MMRANRIRATHRDPHPVLTLGHRYLLCLPVLALLGACDPAEEKSAETAATSGPAPVTLAASSVGTVAMNSFKPEFSLPAVIEAVQTAHPSVDISANITAIHFTAGQLVNKGDLLIEFDASDYELRVQAAEAELQVAEAAVEKAAANWKRAQELKPKGYVSEQMFDEARAAEASAQAEQARAQANLNQVHAALARSSISAAFSGKISRPNYAEGEFYDDHSPSTTTPLFELVQLDPIYATSSVDLARYNNFVLTRQRLVQEGQEIPELVVELELAGGYTYPYPGTFENWDNTSTASSGSIAGRVKFDNPDGLLLPGQNVVLKGRVITPVTAPIIPQRAVLQDQQGHYVMLVGEDNTVQRRNVDVGIRTGPNWAIREGLEEGERVILDGGGALRPGTPIVVATE